MYCLSWYTSIKSVVGVRVGREIVIRRTIYCVNDGQWVRRKGRGGEWEVEDNIKYNRKYSSKICVSNGNVNGIGNVNVNVDVIVNVNVNVKVTVNVNVTGHISAEYY